MEAPSKFSLVGQLCAIDGSFILAAVDDGGNEHYLELTQDGYPRLRYAHKPVKLRSSFESQLLALLEGADVHPAAKQPNDLRAKARLIVSLVRSDDYVTWHSQCDS